MGTVKAILPVAGIGTRLRPHTISKPKVLLEVAGKPILGYIMEEISHLPIEEVIFIIGNMGDQIKKYISENFNIKTRFVLQKEQQGLGHAIYLAYDQIKPEDDILIVLGDTIFDTDLKEVIQSTRSRIGVKEVENPKRFGVVTLENDRITGFVEKPDTPVSNLAIVGIYFIKNSKELFSALEEIIKNKKRTKGEFQLTDALQRLVETGHDFGVFPVQGWFDCGKQETLLSTNQYLLNKYSREISIEGSIIIPPVHIGLETTVSSSIIGPYVSVGDHCTIKRSILRNSIIYSNTAISSSILTDTLTAESSTLQGEISPHRIEKIEKDNH
jgi:glucose-1-phosphate thymidylyltransferase